MYDVVLDCGCDALVRGSMINRSQYALLLYCFSHLLVRPVGSGDARGLRFRSVPESRVNSVPAVFT